MKRIQGTVLRLFCCMFALSNSDSASAFSLRGPAPDWREKEGVYSANYEDGVMNLGEEYRWNIPVITYAFAPDFVDYFGTRGLEEVEKAIATINALPSPDELVVEDYKQYGTRVNPKATALGLSDLKSWTLRGILHQIGMADSQNSIFVFRDGVIDGGDDRYTVIKRNFDPKTFQPSSVMNGNLHTYEILEDPILPASIHVYSVDPLLLSSPATTTLRSGQYFDTFTQDDIGALRFLYSPDNINTESLSDDVEAANPGEIIIRTARRPGIGLPHFSRVEWDPSDENFTITLPEYTDTFYRDGELLSQQVRRVIHKPDLIFSARDLGAGVPFSISSPNRWKNNSIAHGGAQADGPGTISAAEITFSKLGSFFSNGGVNLTQPSLPDWQWAAFDGGTNAPFIFPDPIPLISTLTATFENGKITLRAPTDLPNPIFQSSTNLSSWESLGEGTTEVMIELDENQPVPQRFFRLIAE